MKRKEVTTFADADAVADEFESVLRQLGIELAIGSTLEHSLLLWRAFADAHRQMSEGGAKPDLGLDESKDAILAAGGLAIAELVIRHHKHPCLPSIAAHLRLLNGDQPIQTLRSERMDDASNKIAELVIALAAMGLTEDVELDDPEASSGGQNPDVLARLDGRCWGFACKAIHGDNPATLDERVREAVDQIERSAAAEVGIVVISFKNRVPAPTWFYADEDQTPYPDEQEMMDRWSAFAKRRIDQMVEHATPSEVLNTFDGKKALPGVLVVHDAVGVVRRLGHPVLTRQSALQVIPFRPVDENDLTSLARLNDSRQGIV